MKLVKVIKFIIKMLIFSSHIIRILSLFDNLTIDFVWHKDSELLDSAQVSSSCAGVLEFAPDVGVPVFEENFSSIIFFAENLDVSFSKCLAHTVNFELSQLFIDLDFEHWRVECLELL